MTGFYCIRCHIIYPSDGCCDICDDKLQYTNSIKNLTVDWDVIRIVEGFVNEEAVR